MNRINKSLGFLTHSILLVLMLFAFEQITLADQTPQKPVSCKIKRKILEENFKKYRTGEIPVLENKDYFMFCRAARPVLEKYNLDADSMIHNFVAELLQYTYSKFNMRLLAAQVETLPLEYLFAVRKLSYYKCKDLLKLKTKRRENLRTVIIAETRRDPDFLANGAGTLLQCFAEKDEQARQFLIGKDKF